MPDRYDGQAWREGERARLLREHADAVLDVRDRAKRACEEMMAREVELLVFDDFSPRLAEQAARNNLGVRLKDLEAELSAELGRLQDELHRKMSRLMEDEEEA